MKSAKTVTRRLDLSEAAPPIATYVTLQYDIRPAQEHVVLSARADASAGLSLSGSGEIEIKLVEPQAVYLICEEGIECRIACVAWRF